MTMPDSMTNGSGRARRRIPGPALPRRALLAAALALALTATALAPPAQAQPAARAGAQASAESQLALPALDTWQLDNGMQVAFLRIADAPVLSVQVWYHVGSKDEPRDRRGLAHMFEHMMFKGTENLRSEEHARFIDSLGGYTNAVTSEDATRYINVIPKQYLDFVCQLESERMRKLLFRDSMIRTEREVVKEEVRQQENNPLTVGLLRFLATAYTKHPYAWTAGGTIADLDAASTADLKRFYDTYYVPNNAMLVVVGDASADAVKAAAERWFAPIPRGQEPPRPADDATEPKQTSKRREVVAPGQVGVLLAGYHVPSASDDDSYPLQVASLVLGAGESSRLTQRLVRGDELAVQAGALLLAREHPGMLWTFAIFLSPGAAGDIESALAAEVARLASEGPSADELRKAKHQLQAGLAFSLENVAGLAEQIGMSWILSGDPGRWRNDLARYRAVTADEVKRAAAAYLVDSNLTVVVVPPAGAPQ